MISKWLLRQNKADIKKMSAVLDINPITAAVLANRGIRNKKDAMKFLFPEKKHLYDPFEMLDMEKGVDIILNNIKEEKKIALYGDYDVDGVMSIAILYKALVKCGADVLYYVPHRSKEGYGLNEEAVLHLKKCGVHTIFTCDNGIASLKEVLLAKSLHMDVIILDHHEPGFVETEGVREDVLPVADAVIDPKQKNCRYPFPLLCTGGLSLKFVSALYHKLDIDFDEFNDFVVLAALATICDIVDLIDENRLIAKLGLNLMKETNNIGLNALLKETNILDKEISEYHAGFVIGPCINATGRLTSAEEAIRLFLTEDEEEALMLAQRLVALNGSRKSLTEKAVKEVESAIEEGDFQEDRVLVAYNENIHESIAGIVAGRIKEKYYLPTIIITKGENCPKGSGRSIEGYHIFNELFSVRELFVKFGGHPMACGLSIQENKIPELRKRLNENCKLTDDQLAKKIRVDKIVSTTDLTFELYYELAGLAPFGKGNPAPVLSAKKFLVTKIDFIGVNKTILRFAIEGKGKKVTGICFDGYDDFKTMAVEKFGEEYFQNALRNIFAPIHMDFIFSLHVNEYNGNRSLQMLIKEFRFY